MKNIAFAAFLFTAILGIAHCEDTKVMTQSDKALEVVLADFAKQRKITSADLSKMLAKYLFGQPLLSFQGGLGVIDSTAHVDLIGSTNRILFENGKRDWKGKSRGETEMVILERKNGKAHSVCSGASASADVILIIFTDSIVQIIDPTTGDGGFYPRREKK